MREKARRFFQTREETSEYYARNFNFWIIVGIGLSILCGVATLYLEIDQSHINELVFSILVGVIGVSISLYVISYLHMKEYRKQQKELLEARKAAERANLAKSTFLANMSHEIRTPVHVILSVNEMIRRDSYDKKMKEYAAKIQSAGEILQGLVDNILDVSKIEAGKIEINEELYAVSDMMSVLILTGQTRCGAKGLKFQYFADNMPEYLCGDLIHIRRIVINLLSNAVKYTEKGTVTLSVACEKINNNQVKLQFVVEDTGIGIKEESMDRLFDAFVRADLPTHKYIEGTGLGLAIVKQLTERMGGSVSVSSKLGEGSRFLVELVQKVPETVVEKEKTEKMFEAPEGKVLIVDDNIENLSVIKALLERTKLQIDTAVSGEACIQAVSEREYHVIILDYMMPDMDGMETLRKLKMRTDFNTPVIAFTANAVAGTREKLYAAGFADFIAKPIPFEKLEGVLLKYLPEELVIYIEQKADKKSEMIQLTKVVEEQAQEYDINLPLGLSFYNNDIKDYAKAAGIAIQYYNSEYEKVMLCQTEEHISELRFVVHAIKSKAHSLGLEKLSIIAENIESLCKNERYDEARSLLPYLFYVWKVGRDGVEVIAKTVQAYFPEQNAGSHKNREEILSILPELLKNYRRKQSLSHVDDLIALEDTEEGKVFWGELRSLIIEMDFELAQVKLNEYLEEGMKNGL